MVSQHIHRPGGTGVRPDGGKDREHTMYSVGQQVIYIADGRLYVITVKHTNGDVYTYDIALVGDSQVTHLNVPEGGIKPPTQ